MDDFRPNPLVQPIHAAFMEVMDLFNRTPAITHLKSGELTLAQYKSVLREIYHYTKENPQLQALAAVHFRGRDRQLVKPFLRHAISEVGHDLAALEDLRALGEIPQEVLSENPLPATLALTSFAFFQIDYRNPVGYLGYLYFLEHMPTQHGATYADALMKAQVPESAMGFLREHMTVDVGHNKLMEQYLEQLLHGPADADAVIYAMQVTAELYAQMLWAAILRAEKAMSYGTSWSEAVRLRSDDSVHAGLHIDAHRHESS